MTIKIDIVSGFLGAGKTTLIKKLIKDNSQEKIAIIENEFGAVSIDGDLLRSKNVNIKEISSGCICCSIEGSFRESLIQILEKYKPTRIVIEPSGVAKLSEIKASLMELCKEWNLDINYIFTVVDVRNFRMYMDNFNEFYKDQIQYSKTILLTRIDIVKENEYKEILTEIRNINKRASIIAVPLEELETGDILDIANMDIEKDNSIKLIKSTDKIVSKSIIRNTNRADDVFDSWGIETNNIFTKENLKNIFNEIQKDEDYGYIIRGKGIVKAGVNKWVEFQYTPGTFVVKEVGKNKKGKIAIIGEKIDKKQLNLLFS